MQFQDHLGFETIASGLHEAWMQLSTYALMAEATKSIDSISGGRRQK